MIRGISLFRVGWNAPRMSTRENRLETAESAIRVEGVKTGHPSGLVHSLPSRRGGGNVAVRSDRPSSMGEAERLSTGVTTA